VFDYRRIEDKVEEIERKMFEQRRLDGRELELKDSEIKELIINTITSERARDAFELVYRCNGESRKRILSYLGKVFSLLDVVIADRLLGRVNQTSRILDQYPQYDLSELLNWVKYLEKFFTRRVKRRRIKECIKELSMLYMITEHHDMLRGIPRLGERAAKKIRKKLLGKKDPEQYAQTIVRWLEEKRLTDLAKESIRKLVEEEGCPELEGYPILGILRELEIVPLVEGLCEREFYCPNEIPEYVGDLFNLDRISLPIRWCPKMVVPFERRVIEEIHRLLNAN